MADEESKPEQVTQPRKGKFQIGLGRMLVLLLVAGSAIGLWGRTYLSQPELALMILSLGSVVIPFLVAVFLLFSLASRADSPGLITTSAVLVLMTPVLGLATVAFLSQLHYRRVGPIGLSSLSTTKLIEQELPAKIQEPWVWDELENRLAANNLSGEDIDAAIAVLVEDMSQDPKGFNRPLHWADDFVRQASESGLADQEGLFQVYEAYMPKQEVLKLRRIRESAKAMDIDVVLANSWADNSEFGFTLLGEVMAVRIDGKDYEFEVTLRSGDRRDLRVTGPFQAGKFEVEVDVKYAFVDDDKLVGLQPERLPAKAWPAPMKTWQKTHSAPFTVLGQNETVVELVQGATKPVVDLQRLLIQPRGSDQTQLSLVMTAQSELPLAFSVVAIYEEREIRLGSFVQYQHENQSHRTSSLRATLREPLPADCKELKVVLRPQPNYLDSEEAIKRIYGEELTYFNVPLERFDVDLEE